MQMKALVVEDETFSREYLSSLLRNEFSFDEVVEASDGEDAWELYQKDEFKFVVLDLLIPRLDGIQLARRILEESRDRRVLALSSECDDYTVREISRCGVLGFVSKSDMSLDVIKEAYREVLSGHVYYSQSVQEVLRRIQVDPDAYFKVLSERELQVLQAVGRKQNKQEIATDLGISHFTVRRHRQNAMSKLGLKNDSELLHFALDKGIVKHKGGIGWT